MTIAMAIAIAIARVPLLVYAHARAMMMMMIDRNSSGPGPCSPAHDDDETHPGEARVPLLMMTIKLIRVRPVFPCS